LNRLYNKHMINRKRFKIPFKQLTKIKFQHLFEF